MKPVTIILMLLVTVNLFRDFNRDKGEHKKAKVFHFVCSLLLILSFSGVLSYFLAVFTRFDEVRDLHEVPIGILPAQLVLWSFMVKTILSVALVFIVFRLVQRNERARRLLILIIPAIMVTQTISFYQGFIGDEVFQNMNHWAVLLLGFIIIGSAGAVVMMVYNSALMKAFFLSPVKLKQGTKSKED